MGSSSLTLLSALLRSSTLSNGVPISLCTVVRLYPSPWQRLRIYRLNTLPLNPPGTKYFGGHSDLLCGVLILKTQQEWEKVSSFHVSERKALHAEVFLLV